MNIQEFFADPHLDTADGFGSWAGGRTNAHRGLDVNGWGTGTDVPNLYAGTVSRSEWQDGLGNVVCIATDAGFYLGYAHLNSRWVEVGQRVNVNDLVGTLGNTGSLSYGAHTHVTVSTSSNDPSSGPTIDPLPYIIAARDGGAVPGGINGGSGANDASLRRIGGDDILYWEPTGGLAQRIGAAMIATTALPPDYAQYNDGDPGSNWRIGVQQALINTGYWDGTPDGLLGVNNLNGIQQLAFDRGGYTDVIDADPQINSWTGFAVALESLIPAAPTPAPEAAVIPTPEPAPEVIIPEAVEPIQPQETVVIETTTPEVVAPEVTEVVVPITEETKPAKEAEKVDPKQVLTTEQYNKIQADVAAMPQDDEDNLRQYDLISLSFWNYAAERVIKTFAMTFAAMLSTTGAVVVTQPETANVFSEIGWGYIAAVAGVSALTSLLVALSSFKNIVTMKPKKK